MQDVSLLKALTGELVNEVTATCQQFHGGMGFMTGTPSSACGATRACWASAAAPPRSCSTRRPSATEPWTRSTSGSTARGAGLPQPPRGAQRLQRRRHRRADRGLRAPGRRRRRCAPSCSAATARPSAPAPTCRGCARWPTTPGSRTAPTRRPWPTCCGRCTAARCRSSAASTATATPAASAWRRCATCWSPPTACSSACREARLGPAAGDHRALRRRARWANRRRGATSSPPSASTPHARRALGFVHEVRRGRGAGRHRRRHRRDAGRQRPGGGEGLQAAGAGPRRRPIDAALRDDTARRIADVRASAEGREGVQSFLDKREPAWRRR